MVSKKYIKYSLIFTFTLISCTAKKESPPSSAKEQQQATIASLEKDGASNEIKLTNKSALQDFILYAVYQHPKIKTAIAEYHIATEDIKTISNRPDWQIEISADIAKTVESIMVGAFWSFSNRHKIKSQKHSAEITVQEKYIDLLAATTTIALQVKNIYAQLYYKQKELKTNQIAQKITQQQIQNTKNLYSTGQALLSEIQDYRNELLQLQQENLQIKQDLAILNVQWYLALGIPYQENNSLIPTLIQKRETHITKDQIENLAIFDNAAQKKLFLEAQRIAIEKSNIKKNNQIDLTPGIMADIKSSPIMFTPSLSIHIPVNGKKKAAELKSNEYKTQALQQKQQEESLNKYSKFAEIWVLYQNLQNQLKHYQQTLIPQIEKTIHLLKQQYSLQKTPLHEIYSAQLKYEELLLKIHALQLNLNLLENELQWQTLQFSEDFLQTLSQNQTYTDTKKGLTHE